MLWPLELKHPITVQIRAADGQTTEREIKVITLDLPDDGKLRACHLRATDGVSGRVAMTLALAELFGDQPMKVLDQLVDEDFMEVFDRLQGFQTGGPRTGPESSV